MNNDTIEKTEELAIDEINSKTEELPIDDINKTEELSIDEINKTEELNIAKLVEEDNQNQILDSNESNITPENNSLPNSKYHGFKYYLTRYIIIILILVTVLIIFSIGYNFSKNDILKYTYSSKLNYQVCLNENKYYKEQCLNENTEYISSITDKINIDFNYSGVYEDVQKRKAEYYIKSVLLIKTDSEDAKELYKDEKDLTKHKKININKNVIAINESVSIPFKEYNNYAEKYKNDYSLIGRGTLDISLIVKENNQEKEVSKITIPLTQLTYSISKQETNNKIETYNAVSHSKIKYFFIGLLTITLLLLLYSIYSLIKFLLKTLPKQSKYNKKLKKILNVYDRVIITLEDKATIVNDNEVYKVKTFLELLDVRDTIDKPILYYKVNDIKTEFYVQDENKTYKYVMKESDFENEK